VKITKKYLRELIKEEIERGLSESELYQSMPFDKSSATQNERALFSRGHLLEKKVMKYLIQIYDRVEVLENRIKEQI